ncbi:MAG: DoxX family membrane protein, partial [Dehalococcoidia bacterium]|nr:DoxX family membrane protein [Dehalococcoidia bacterium]
MAQTAKEPRSVTFATDPPLAQRLFATSEFAWLWMIARIWLGYQWFISGSGKLGNPGWMDTGAALKGYWTNAAAIPATGRPPIVFDWYRDFIKFLLDSGSYVWFAKLIAVGEVLIGVALIIGAFVGIAAFLGSLMNWNFMMAGSASTNPMLFAVAT